jgi:hypothetical protein
MLKPQDILILLKIQSVRGRRGPLEGTWENPEFLLRYSVLGTSVGISTSQAFESVKRLVDAGLVTKELQVRTRAAAEWLIHGVKYCLPPKLGGLTRGTPTSYAAAPLKAMLVQSDASQEPIPVWPYADGVRGIALEPIYKTVPWAAEKDEELKEYLTLLDAIRSGRTRESNLASDILSQKLGVN